MESPRTGLDEPLIHVTWPVLFQASVPLLGLAVVSYRRNMQLESPIIVGLLRTVTQLSILGAVLAPIFGWGVEHGWIVVCVLLWMMSLAAMESSARTKYYMKGLIESVGMAIMICVGSVSFLTFGVLLRPTPVWNPQYVIPISGMLLGNVISGLAVSLSSLLTALVEHASQVELRQAFGASPAEASDALVQEAVRVGTLPMLNSMAVIGLITIPGMMTGQILGGSSPMEAAKYQMLIMILIATATFATILLSVEMVQWHTFSRGGLLRSDRFVQRPKQLSFLDRVINAVVSIPQTLRSWYESLQRQWRRSYARRVSLSASMPNAEFESLTVHVPQSYVAPTGTLQLYTVQHGTGGIVLELRNISKTITTGSDSQVLFQQLNYTVGQGDIVAISGPSGVGKSQLLRLVGALSPFDDDDVEQQASDILLLGQSLRECAATHWRRQVRYVSQYKVDIVGTPRDFLETVANFQSWRSESTLRESLRSSLRNVMGSNVSLSSTSSRRLRTMPTFDEMIATCLRMVQQWGLQVSCLDKEWKQLSGGEAQRVIVAIAIASEPKVLLLDESTSALDLDAKTRVEHSIQEMASERGMTVLWITHDKDQLNRLGRMTVWDRRLSDTASSPAVRASI